MKKRNIPGVVVSHIRQWTGGALLAVAAAIATAGGFAISEIRAAEAVLGLSVVIGWCGLLYAGFRLYETNH